MSNLVDYSRLNGDSGKRGAEDAPCDSTPAKKPALESVMTNGFANGNKNIVAQLQQQQVNGNVKLGGQVVQVVSSGVGCTAQTVHNPAVQIVQAAAGGGQMVQAMTTTGGQIVHSSGGQMVQVTTGAGNTGGQQLLVSSTGIIRLFIKDVVDYKRKES